MKIRLYADVELSDQQMVEGFGAQLPTMIASHTIEAGIAKAVETVLVQLPAVQRAKVIYIPELLP